MTALVAAGFAVQLSHDEAEKQGGADATGWVKVVNPAGDVIAEHKDYQHNRNYRNRESLTPELMVIIKKAMASEEGAGGEVEAAEDKAQGAVKVAEAANAGGEVKVAAEEVKKAA